MFRLRLPTLTAAEKSALAALLAILGSGAGLHAWERSGLKVGPVRDWESLRERVVQARVAGDSAAFPCLEPPREFGETWPKRTQDPEPAPAASRSRPKKGPPASPLDLNTAEVGDLERLPGVGPTTAKAIAASRASEGAFASVEDLLRVKGIGDKKFAALRIFVRVGRNPTPSDSLQEAAGR